MLVITAEFSALTERGESALRHAMIELALLIVTIGVLVACLVALIGRRPERGR